MNSTDGAGGGATGQGPIERVRELVDPIADDLGLDVYDVEQRGGTLRVVLDTPIGHDGITLDVLSLATRLVSRELDHADPLPGRYTLEVSSPGVERSLRTADHFRRAIDELVAVRLRDVPGDERRVEGRLVAADDETITVRPDTTAADTDQASTDRVIALDEIDRARTVFVWEAQPKPKGGGGAATGSRSGRHPQPSTRPQSGSTSRKPKEKKSP